MASPFIEIPVGDRLVKVTNPNKVDFPEHGYTKRQLVEYFVAVGEGILRATRDRPTTLERWPAGVFEGARMATREDYARGQAGLGAGKSDAFYQKRVPKGAPDWVRTVRITFPSGRSADEVCPTEPAVIAWAANLGTLMKMLDEAKQYCDRAPAAELLDLAGHQQLRPHRHLPFAVELEEHQLGEPGAVGDHHAPRLAFIGRRLDAAPPRPPA